MVRALSFCSVALLSMTWLGACSRDRQRPRAGEGAVAGVGVGVGARTISTGAVGGGLVTVPGAAVAGVGVGAGAPAAPAGAPTAGAPTAGASKAAAPATAGDPVAMLIVMFPSAAVPVGDGAGGGGGTVGAGAALGPSRTYKLSLAADGSSASLELDGQPVRTGRVERVYAGDGRQALSPPAPIGSAPRPRPSPLRALAAEPAAAALPRRAPFSPRTATATATASAGRVLMTAPNGAPILD